MSTVIVEKFEKLEYSKDDVNDEDPNFNSFCSKVSLFKSAITPFVLNCRKLSIKEDENGMLDLFRERHQLPTEVELFVTEVLTQTAHQKVCLTFHPTKGVHLALNDRTQRSGSSPLMEYFVHGSIALTTGKIRVLILGGGDGGVLTEVLKYDSVTQVTLVEIDEEVINICQKYSPTGNAESMGDAIELLIGDAMDYLAYTKDTFDLILCDIPDGYMGYYIEDGPVTKVTFAKLLEGAGRVLNPDGVLATLYTDEKGPSHYVPTFRRANSVTLDDHNGFLIATKRDSDMRVPLREPVEGLSFYSHEKHSERFFGMDFTEDCRQEYIQWLESKLPAENEKKADEARVKVEKLRQDLAEAEAELKMAVKKTKTVPQRKSSGKAKSATTSAAMPRFAGITLKRNGGKFTLGSANTFEKQSKFTRPVKVQTGTYLGGSFLSGTSRRGGAVGSGWNSSSRSAAGQSDLKRSDTPRSRPGSRCGSRPGTPAKTRTSDTPAVKTGAAATGKVDCSRFQTPERMPSRPATPRGSPYVTPVKSRPSSRPASPGPVTYNLHGRSSRSNSLVRSDAEQGALGEINPITKKGGNKIKK